jgi:hypothetical protein
VDLGLPRSGRAWEDGVGVWEVIQVLSAASLLPADAGLVRGRAPRHNISVAGLIGGSRL